MIGPRPEFPWDEYLNLEHSEDEKFRFEKLKSNAPDDIKEHFEKCMNLPLGKVTLKRLAPELKNPYYTWDGRIIEKEELDKE